METNNTEKEASLETVTRELRLTYDELDNNRKEMRAVEEIEDLAFDLHKEQNATLEELAQTWQGGSADRLLAEAFEANDLDYRQTMVKIDEEQMRLSRNREALLSRENELRRQSQFLSQANTKGA